MNYILHYNKCLKAIWSLHLIVAVCSIFSVCFASAQTYEDQYKQPLHVVLKNIEARYNVRLQYNAALVKDRSVSFAGWRFRSDLKSTLDAILPLHDLVSYKVSDTVYTIEPFAYWQKPVAEGARQLDSFVSAYNTIAKWTTRKVALRRCMLKTLRLETLPPAPAAAPIVTPKRYYNGYAVQNVALETLPGLFVCGSLYSPIIRKGKRPVVLSPNGHFSGGRYRADQQVRCAALARMGALVFTYDLLGWGESRLQFKDEDHYTSTALTVQTLNSFRILDFMCSLKDADTTRVAITGASGGGSQAMLLTALTDRIKVSVPVVMLSCYYAGGCPCETGLPLHWCGGGTNNPEIAAMAAPRPQLVVSDGKDWTDHVPQIEFPYLRRMYGLYNKKDAVKNVHLPEEGHDYGSLKRNAMYPFLAKHLNLNLRAIQNKLSIIDESFCTIEDESKLLIFGNKGEKLPPHAISGMDALLKLLDASLIK
jgi:hypothetical protein